ncbi:MAG: hypothetical protein LBQ81_08645 [Zoogloeaceae bacterium]|jgi:hypothetical protein|nr:hypothetical protein [Zoogloeaceae bacterium]
MNRKAVVKNVGELLLWILKALFCLPFIMLWEGGKAGWWLLRDEGLPALRVILHNLKLHWQEVPKVDEE